MTERVLRLLGTDVMPKVAAQIQVERSAEGYSARMRIETPAGGGVRLLEDTQCDQLADGVALVYALSVPSAEPARSRWRWSLAAYGGAIVGPLPALAAAGAVALGVESGALRLELTGSYLLPQIKQHTDGQLSGRFHALAASVRAGVVVPLDRLELAPNLGLRLYDFSAAGRGGVSSRTVWEASWGPTFGLLARLRITEHWALGLRTEVDWLPQRVRFVFSDAGSLHQPAAISFGAWFGAEARL